MKHLMTSSTIPHFLPRSQASPDYNKGPLRVKKTPLDINVFVSKTSGLTQVFKGLYTVHADFFSIVVKFRPSSSLVRFHRWDSLPLLRVCGVGEEV